MKQAKSFQEDLRKSVLIPQPETKTVCEKENDQAVELTLPMMTSLTWSTHLGLLTTSISRDMAELRSAMG